MWPLKTWPLDWLWLEAKVAAQRLVWRVLILNYLTSLVCTPGGTPESDTFAVRRIYNRKQLEPTVDTCHCTLSGFQVGMYLTRTQNLYQSRYNSFPEFKWPHTAAENTSITLTAHAKKAHDAKERNHQNELYCISASASSFTTHYRRFLPLITSLKLRRLHRCLCSRCGTTNERLAGLQLCT